MSDAAADRAAAANALHRILEQNRTIDWVLQNKPELLSAPLRRELVYGVLRRYFSIAASVQPLLAKPLRSKDRVIWALLLVGAYQLRFLDKPDHAIVHSTVAACKLLKRPWAKGMVNAILRQLERGREQAGDEGDTEQSFEHPEWLTAKLLKQYDNAADVLAANNQRAPMTLRINTTRIGVDEYLSMLNAAHMPFRNGQFEETVILLEPVRSETLPGWTEGYVSVQDQATQFAGRLLHQLSAQRPKLRLLDACAAPGGKLFHSLELVAQHRQELDCIAIDASPARIENTQQIGARLGHTITLQTGDASQLDWWDQQPFDLILVDAPCSATGTIRRNPDIKLLCRPEHVQQHAQLQTEILSNLWSTLRPGGTLLYCTCSLLCEENDDVVAQLLQSAAAADGAAERCDITLPSGSATRFGWQCLPTDPDTDGFYYAALKKAGS